MILPLVARAKPKPIPLPSRKPTAPVWDEEAEEQVTALCLFNKYNDALADWTLACERWHLQDERLQLAGFEYTSRPLRPDFKWFAPVPERGSDASGLEALWDRDNHDEYCPCRGVWADCCNNPLNYYHYPAEVFLSYDSD